MEGKHMKSSRYMGVKSQKLMEAPVPTCGENDVLCKTIYCGICGSDIAGYFHGSDFFWEDCDWGHEPVCEVAEVGKNVSGIHAGERVFRASSQAGSENISLFKTRN